MMCYKVTGKAHISALHASWIACAHHNDSKSGKCDVPYNVIGKL